LHRFELDDTERLVAGRRREDEGGRFLVEPFQSRLGDESLEADLLGDALLSGVLFE